MEFQEEIVRFISGQIGGVTILAEGSGEIVYADGFYQNKYGNDVTGMFGEDVYLWLSDCPAIPDDGSTVEWESIDTDTRKYYKIISGRFEKEEKQYQILANAVRQNMDMKKIYEIIEKGNAAECFI